jgi:hypothetical protein
MIEAFTHWDYQKWLHRERAKQPRFRTDEVSDEEVIRAIRTVFD